MSIDDIPEDGPIIRDMSLEREAPEGYTTVHIWVPRDIAGKVEEEGLHRENTAVHLDHPDKQTLEELFESVRLEQLENRGHSDKNRPRVSRKECLYGCYVKPGEEIPKFRTGSVLFGAFVDTGRAMVTDGDLYVHAWEFWQGNRVKKGETYAREFAEKYWKNAVNLFDYKLDKGTSVPRYSFAAPEVLIPHDILPQNLFRVQSSFT